MTKTARPCPGCAKATRDGLLCHRCTAAVRGQLDRLAALWPTLEEAITRQTRMGAASEGRSGAVYGVVPFEPGASRVARQIRAGLWRWIRDAIDDHGRPAPADTIPAWCRTLADDLPSIRREPDSAELGVLLTGSLRDLLRAVDYPDDRASIATGRPCPERTGDGEPCGGRLVAVIPREGTPHIDCPIRDGIGCGRTWAPQRWAEVIAAVEVREAMIAGQRARGCQRQAGRYLPPVEWGPRLDLISVADAAVVYGVPRSTLYRWIADGWIREHRGEEGIRVSPVDVSRAIVEHPTREALGLTASETGA